MSLEIPPQLNDEFLEKILKKAENDQTLSISKKTVTCPTKTGDNYLSDMYRVYLDFKRNGENITEKRSFIVKMTPSQQEMATALVENNDLFTNEIQMMTSTLREMQLLLNDTKLCGECYYAQEKDPSILVIEDLNALGYRMVDRKNGLDLQHCLLAMKALAKFHASSVAVCEKNPTYKLKYRGGIFRKNPSPEMKSMINCGVKSMAEVAKSWPAIDKACADKLIKLSENIYDKLGILTQPEQSQFNVINHGDFFLNNMLFFYDAEKKPVDLTFVDFQYSVYTSPAVDLQYFLHSSPREEVSINHRDDLINEYHKTLCETMKKMNCKTRPPTMADLNELLKNLELVGLPTACITLYLVLQKQNDKKLLEKFIEGEKSLNPEIYNIEEFKTALTRRIIHWYKMGLLD